MRLFECYLLPVRTGELTRERALGQLTIYLTQIAYCRGKHESLRLPEPYSTEELGIYRELAEHPWTDTNLRDFIRAMIRAYGDM